MYNKLLTLAVLMFAGIALATVSGPQKAEAATYPTYQNYSALYPYPTFTDYQNWYYSTFAPSAGSSYATAPYGGYQNYNYSTYNSGYNYNYQYQSPGYTPYGMTNYGSMYSSYPTYADYGSYSPYSIYTGYGSSPYMTTSAGTNPFRSIMACAASQLVCSLGNIVCTCNNFNYPYFY
jgi:hypothetical protein